jgi:hypothetical protein
VPVFVLRVQGRLAEQRDCNTDCSKEHGSAASDFVENEKDKEEIGERAEAVVDTGDKNVGAAGDPEILVHDSLVVVDNVDTCHLREYLDENTVPVPVSRGQ